jgi:hypothetical protein
MSPFVVPYSEALGAPVGKGSKPLKTGEARPDLPVGDEFDVPLQSGNTARLKGVSDFKDVGEIYNSPDKYGKRQLTEMFNDAISRGEPFNLIVSPRTRYITPEVADFIRKSKGKLLEFDPATMTFRSLPIGDQSGAAWRRPES